MSDDDSQTARGGTFSGPANFSDPTARSIDALNAAGARRDELDSTVLSSHILSLASDATPIRLSIPGELHFEILGTPTVGQLAQYARLIESLIVIAEFAAGARSET